MRLGGNKVDVEEKPTIKKVTEPMYLIQDKITAETKLDLSVLQPNEGILSSNISLCFTTLDFALCRIYT